MTGTSEGCNQWVGGLPPSRLGRAYVFLNKSTKRSFPPPFCRSRTDKIGGLAMPYINRPYKPKYRILANLLGTHYIDPKEDAESEKVIDLALFPSHVDDTGRVHFLPASAIPQSAGIIRKEEARMALKEVRPDLIVYCTGYKTEFPWLEASYIRSANVDTRSICDSSDVTVGFLGLVVSFLLAFVLFADIRFNSDQELELFHRLQRFNLIFGRYYCSNEFLFLLLHRITNY